MTTRDIHLNYDDETDVMYVTRKGINKANTTNLGVDADITVRLNRKTSEMVGFTITDFSTSKFGRLKGLTEFRQMEEFDFLMDTINAIVSKREHVK